MRDSGNEVEYFAIIALVLKLLRVWETVHFMVIVNKVVDIFVNELSKISAALNTGFFGS